MDYNENEFKAKANIKARRIWLVFALLLSANYGSDVSQGGYPSTNYIIFLILCWVPFFAGDLLLRIRGKADDRYRYALVIGYGIFEFVSGISGIQSGIAHFAHLGGMLFGYLMIRYWKKRGIFR